MLITNLYNHCIQAVCYYYWSAIWVTQCISQHGFLESNSSRAKLPPFSSFLYFFYITDHTCLKSHGLTGLGYFLQTFALILSYLTLYD